MRSKTLLKTKSERVAGGLRNLFYRAVRSFCRVLCVLLFEVRCFGREHSDFSGGALILSTHQSHFDPMLVGIVFNRRLNFLARRTLFKNRAVGLFIRSLNAFELDRERGGLTGLKETIRRLRQGQPVLIFPEGTRTGDGKIAPLKPGFIAIARRCRVPLIPMAITGAYEALPKSAIWPRRYPLRIAVGPRIDPVEQERLDDDALLELVARRLQECYWRAERTRRT